MAYGPGKYDDECTALLKKTGATITIVIVVDGEKGSGFSVSSTSYFLLANIPSILRNVADQIKRDMES